MPAYRLVDAKSRLPSLIDDVLRGEKVVITRHGKPVAELIPARQEASAPLASYEWLRARRDARPGTSLTSMELLRRLDSKI